MEDDKHAKENVDPIANDLSQMSITSNKGKRKQRQGRIEGFRANGINIIANADAMDDWSRNYKVNFI